MPSTVYIETTIPSYLMAWPSKNIVRAAHQQLTQEWWTNRHSFTLYTSRLVIRECQSGDTQAAMERIQSLQGIPLLEQTEDATQLAEQLLKGVPLPPHAATDALHIAISTVHGVNYLLPWNCRHIANVTLRPKIEEVCQFMGFRAPLICTPEELSN